jgi:hypothetical protein
MNNSKNRITALLAGALLACSLVPAAAQAQSRNASPPPYATRAGDETIRGTISSINGKYNISVRDQRGYLDNVTLHQGTIINPTGLTLQPGQTVTIHGNTAGSTFNANEIDTPYVTTYVVPWGYGYPYESYRFGVGFPGPRFGFGFRGGF